MQLLYPQEFDDIESENVENHVSFRKLSLPEMTSLLEIVTEIETVETEIDEDRLLTSSKKSLSLLDIYIFVLIVCILKFVSFSLRSKCNLNAEYVVLSDEFGCNRYFD